MIYTNNRYIMIGSATVGLTIGLVVGINKLYDVLKRKLFHNTYSMFHYIAYKILEDIKANIQLEIKPEHKCDQQVEE